MVRKGATTIWERWNSDTGDVAMNSFNHYALGAVSGFLYRRVGGLEPIEPGFSRFRISPLLAGSIGSAGVTYDSVRGRIDINWLRTAAGVRLDLAVPGNTHAEVAVAGYSSTVPQVFAPGMHSVLFTRHATA